MNTDVLESLGYLTLDFLAFGALALLVWWFLERKGRMHDDGSE